MSRSHVWRLVLRAESVFGMALMVALFFLTIARTQNVVIIAGVSGALVIRFAIAVIVFLRTSRQ